MYGDCSKHTLISKPQVLARYSRHDRSYAHQGEKHYSQVYLHL